MFSQPRVETSYTPDRTLTEDRKRKREILSCLGCRRRKLKCDRAYPVCERCQKSSSTCTYRSFQNDDDSGHDIENSIDVERGLEKRPRTSLAKKDMFGAPNGVTWIPPVPVDAQSTSIPPYQDKQQDRTIKSLEARLADLERIISRHGSHDVEVSTSIELGTRDPGTFFFKGRAFKTRFYGPTLPTNQLAHFPEVRVFMQEIHPNSRLESAINECRILEQRYKEQVAKKIKSLPPDLVTLVPIRTEADRLVQLYMDSFENTYCILHKPTFWKEYEIFWRASDETVPGFIPILLLVMAVVRCMLPEEKMSYNGAGSSAHVEAALWIEASSSWLDQQSQKHGTIEMYQVMCLQVLASSATCYKVKRGYQTAEALLTHFRSAGMHRDPILLDSRTSVFEKEMKRRLWAVAVELELQASLDRGIPSTISAVPTDTRSPLNIDDGDLSPDMIQLPSAKSPQHFTSTSFLSVASQSLALRISICYLVNDPNAHLKHEEILQYEQKLTETLAAIPKWQDPRCQQTSILLDIQLRQFLIILHGPFARQTSTSQARYSRFVCLESAKQIIDQHALLLASRNFSLALTREDVFRAALSFCHNSFLCTLNQTDIFFSGVMTSFSQILQNAFEVMKERGMRRGRGLQQVWYVSAARSLVEMRINPRSSETFKARATDDVAALYRKMLDSWEREVRQQKPVSIPGSTRQSVGPDTSSWFYSASVLGFTDNPTPTPSQVPDPELGPFDASDWTLENLWNMDSYYDTLT